MEFASKYDKLNMKCFACSKSNHLSVKCRSLHYLPDLEKLVKSAHFHNAERESFNRKFKKSNIKHSLAHLKAI
jgi:hypothetical protein